MSNGQQQEIPLVDYPNEVSPVDQPEVEIITPHPTPSEPEAVSTQQGSNPIGFSVK